MKPYNKFFLFFIGLSLPIIACKKQNLEIRQSDEQLVKVWVLKQFFISGNIDSSLNGSTFEFSADKKFIWLRNDSLVERKGLWELDYENRTLTCNWGTGESVYTILKLSSYELWFNHHYSWTEPLTYSGDYEYHYVPL